MKNTFFENYKPTFTKKEIIQKLRALGEKANYKNTVIVGPTLNRDYDYCGVIGMKAFFIKGDKVTLK